ncbi:MAG: lysine--tRNA ligase [Chloroflexi bacterium]|nr:lysine--tRNA ligase [Chloroflexota bacterium]
MTTRPGRITEQRLQTLERIKASGIDPYPPRYHCTHTTAQATALLKEQETTAGAEIAVVSVAGRLVASRGMGKSTFSDIRDGSGKIQLLLRSDVLGEAAYKFVKELDLGDIIGATGKLLRTKTGEPTVQVQSFTLLAKSLQPLPEKWHGLVDIETRYRQRYLDLISNEEARQTFRTRSAIISVLRRFMDGRGFMEVETPVFQPEAGGAPARPFITHHNELDRDLVLRISLELYLKRLVVGGFDKVYEIGRIFRNEGLSFKHNPEFTMMESYQAYADYNSVMQMVEEMVSSIAQEVLGTTTIEFDGNKIELKPPWKRIALRDAIAEFSGIDFVQYPEADLLRAKMKEKGMEVDPLKNWAHLVDDLLSTYVERKLMQPTFLLDYPVSLSPLAKRKPGQERVVERFEAFAGGMEIANAFSELNDPLEQRERFVEQAREHRQHDDEERVDEDFLLAMEYGMPPTGGLGVGIDRLVMLLTNNQSIRDVILFPMLKEKG